MERKGESPSHWELCIIQKLSWLYPSLGGAFLWEYDAVRTGYVLRMSREPWLPGHLASGYLGGSSVLSAASSANSTNGISSPEEGPAEYRRHETLPKSNLFLKITALCPFQLCKQKPLSFLSDISLLFLSFPIWNQWLSPVDFIFRSISSIPSNLSILV